MKKIVVASMALLACLFAGCDKTQNTEEEDKTVEADFAQGYPQKWRIRFDGKAYTTWHRLVHLQVETGFTLRKDPFRENQHGYFQTCQAVTLI